MVFKFKFLILTVFVQVFQVHIEDSVMTLSALHTQSNRVFNFHVILLFLMLPSDHFFPDIYGKLPNIIPSAMILYIRFK
jgi:hypothetical protein